jgi:excisionase family DNA binding protein
MRIIYIKRTTMVNILPHACTTLVLLLNNGNTGRGAEKMSETKRKMKTEYLGVAEAESMTGVSRWTWRRWAYDGKIASVKLGKRLVIPASEIERLVAANTRPALERH